MKKIYALLITTIILFTAACQKTPEKLIVQNKGDDDLQNAIEQTAAPTEQISEQVSQPKP